MSEIVDFKEGDHNGYTVLVENVQLTDEQTLMLANGESVKVDIRVHDPFKITDKQRKKIFALVNDIEAHTGNPSEYMRGMFTHYLQSLHGAENRISMASCSKREASDLIEIIMQWIFQHDIPLNYKTSDLLKEDNYFLYLSTVNRQCVICGKPKSDLAHRYAVGRGRNRNKINHFDNEVLALCRDHHNEQHQIGIDSFNNKYKLTDSWIKVDEKLNRMLKGGKNGST